MHTSGKVILLLTIHCYSYRPN